MTSIYKIPTEQDLQAKIQRVVRDLEVYGTAHLDTGGDVVQTHHTPIDPRAYRIFAAEYLRLQAKRKRRS